MSTDEATVTAALVGARRAHQYLRLLELGRKRQAAELLGAVTSPREAAMMAGTLDATAKTAIRAGKLSSAQAQQYAERLTELEAMFMTHQDSAERLRIWLTAFAAETLRVVTLRWPKQINRMDLFELGARTSYEGEAPGSDLRRGVFKEGS